MPKTATLMQVLLSLPLTLLYLYFTTAFKLTNVTVDDTNPAVAYVGQWNDGTGEASFYGGGHRSTTTPGNNATFAFTGWYSECFDTICSAHFLLTKM